MPPRSPISSPAVLASVGVRPHAEREDHDVGRIRLAGLRLHLERAAVQLLESGHAVVERQVDAMPLQMLLDEAGELPVERGQDLIEHLDERHVEPEMDQVLRRLETDEAAADHHRTPRRLHELDARVVVHPRQERRAPLDPLADRPRVRHGPHLEDPRQIDAGQRRTDRRRPGRQHQLVVGLGRDLAGRDIAQVHGLLLRRDGDRLAVRPHVDRELRAEQLLARDQEARFLLDHARRHGRAARSSRTRRTARAPP